MPELSLEEALVAIQGHVEPLGTESVELRASLDRFVADEIRAPWAVPRFDKSAMDGYAIHADDLREGEGVELKLVGSSMAGDPAVPPLVPGAAARVMTGAPLPPGAAAVIIRERAEVFAGDASSPERVRLRIPVGARESNLLRAGSLVRQGQLLMAPGQRVTAGRVGLLAEFGQSAIPVRQRPDVAILATGNELREHGEALGEAEIHNSNGPMLAALCGQTRAVGRIQELGIARDESEPLRRCIRRGMESHLLILSGGVSVGELDLVPRTLAELGVRRVFHGVNIKPGKPIWFGTHPTGIVFGLPGNPVSSFVCFQVFVRAALARLLGTDINMSLREEGRLAVDHTYQTDRVTFWPGKRDPRQRGTIRPLPWKGSSDLRGLAEADVLLELPIGEHTLVAGAGLPVIGLEGPLGKEP